MLILLYFFVSFIAWTIHDFLCYCFMRHKKINFRTLFQWWNGEIDKE